MLHYIASLNVTVLFLYFVLRYVAACYVVLCYVPQLCCFRSVVQYFPMRYFILRYFCSTLSDAVYWFFLDWAILLPDNELDVFIERWSCWERNCNRDVNVRVNTYGNVDGVVKCLGLFPMMIFCWYYDYITLSMENIYLPNINTRVNQKVPGILWRLWCTTSLYRRNRLLLVISRWKFCTRCSLEEGARQVAGTVVSASR
jgi:hypothetical protein